MGIKEKAKQLYGKIQYATSYEGRYESTQKQLEKAEKEAALRKMQKRIAQLNAQNRPKVKPFTTGTSDIIGFGSYGQPKQKRKKTNNIFDF
jgi:hypothetical protein